VFDFAVVSLLFQKKPAMKIKVAYNNVNDGGVVKFPMM